MRVGSLGPMPAGILVSDCDARAELYGDAKVWGSASKDKLPVKTRHRGDRETERKAKTHQWLFYSWMVVY